MDVGKGNDIKEVISVKLTDEQRAAIQRATGVSFKEISVIEHAGESARQLAPGLLKASSVVMCW